MRGFSHSLAAKLTLQDGPGRGAFACTHAGFDPTQLRSIVQILAPPPAASAASRPTWPETPPIGGNPLKLDLAFDDRYFMASNELNLLNTLLLAEEAGDVAED